MARLDFHAIPGLERSNLAINYLSTHDRLWRYMRITQRGGTKENPSQPGVGFQADLLRLEQNGSLGSSIVVDVTITERGMPVCRARATFGHRIPHLVPMRWEPLLASKASPVHALPPELVQMVFEQDAAHQDAYTCVALRQAECMRLQLCTGLSVWQRVLRLFGQLGADD